MNVVKLPLIILNTVNAGCDWDSSNGPLVR